MQKIVKTTVYTEDYKKISALARLNGHKIWEEIAVAIKEYLDKHELTTSTSPSTLSEPATVAPTSAPAPKSTYDRPTVAELIAFLDKEDVPADDTSNELYYGIKKQAPQFKKLDLATFDEAVTIRKERKRRNEL